MRCGIGELTRFFPGVGVQMTSLVFLSASAPTGIVSSKFDFAGVLF